MDGKKKEALQELLKLIADHPKLSFFESL